MVIVLIVIFTMWTACISQINLIFALMLLMDMSPVQVTLIIVTGSVEQIMGSLNRNGHQTSSTCSCRTI